MKNHPLGGWIFIYANKIYNGDKRIQRTWTESCGTGKAIAIQKAKTAERFTEEEMRAYYEQALSLEPQMLINTLVKQITLYDDKTIFAYNKSRKRRPRWKSGLFFLRKTSQNALCKAEQKRTAIPQVYDCAFRLTLKKQLPLILARVRITGSRAGFLQLLFEPPSKV